MKSNRLVTELETVFYDMNSVSYRTETETVPLLLWMSLEPSPTMKKVNPKLKVRLLYISTLTPEA